MTVAGVDAFDWHARLLVGYCPDHDAFYEDMTGRDGNFVPALPKEWLKKRFASR